MITTSGNVEYNLIPSDDGDYIIIEAIGDGDRTDAMEIAAGAFELGMQLGIRCYLNDLTKSRSIDTPPDSLRLAQDDIPHVDPQESRACLAALIDPDDHSHDFYLAFAKSQGIEITVFTDRDKAISYLKDAAPSFNAKPSGS